MRIVALGDRDTQFLTHRELDAALALLPDADWVATDDPAARDLHGVDGVWLLPGTPYRDEATAFGAIRHCVATGTRFLGTCGGFQYACLALARDRAGLASAAHAESDPEAPDPIVERWPARSTARPGRSRQSPARSLRRSAAPSPSRASTGAATASARRGPARCTPPG